LATAAPAAKGRCIEFTAARPTHTSREDPAAPLAAAGRRAARWSSSRAGTEAPMHKFIEVDPHLQHKPPIRRRRRSLGKIAHEDIAA